MTGSISDFEDLQSTLIASKTLALLAFLITLTFQQSPHHPCPRRAGCGHAKAPAGSYPGPRADPAAAETRGGQGGIEPRPDIKREERRRHPRSAGEEGEERGAGRGGRGPWERRAGAGTARGARDHHGHVRARLGQMKPGGNR